MECFFTDRLTYGVAQGLISSVQDTVLGGGCGPVPTTNKLQANDEFVSGMLADLEDAPFVLWRCSL